MIARVVRDPARAEELAVEAFRSPVAGSCGRTHRKLKRGSIALPSGSASTNCADRRGVTAMKTCSRSFGEYLHPNNFTPPLKNRNACAAYSHLFPSGRRNCFCFEVTTSVTANWPPRSIFIRHRWVPCSHAHRNHSERSTFAAMDSNNSIVNNIRLGAARDTTKWVDERLTFLTPDETWNPDVRVAQARLRQRLGATKHNWSRMIGWSGVVFATAVIIAVALTSAPAPRVLAQRCIDCSIAVWQAISPAGASPAKLDPVRSA